MTRLLITGSSGYVGGLLVRRLIEAGHELSLSSRTATSGQDGASRYFAVGEVGSRTDWRPALEGCQTIIHLAAQVPVAGIADAAFHEVNDRGTARLIEQASRSDARRFILMSSISAVADNAAEAPIDENTPPNPSNAYGRSKLAAEGHLRGFDGAGRSAIAVRSPIVYGSAAPGNWRLLQRLAASGVPLPFGAIHNRRTLVAGENLADALASLVSLPDSAARPGTYMVSDDRSVSLAEILTWLRAGMGKSRRLVAVPPALLDAALRMLGKGKVARSLLGNLEVDCKHFRDTFGWSPRISPREGITRSGTGFKD